MAYKPLKLWFDRELASKIGNQIVSIEPSFPAKQFEENVGKQIDDLELKDRVEVFADQIGQCFNKPFTQVIDVLVSILGPENEGDTGMFTNYYWIMPIAKYVEKYGLDDFQVSMMAIEEITKRNTGEYAIRPFLKQHRDLTLTQMQTWSKNANFHVRRLSSEGLRPRLPWATKLQIFIDQPQLIVPVLDNLKDDESRYVQKSVANCINDILKDNREVGMDLIQSWLSNENSNRRWIIKHALRNLIKKDDAWARRLVSN